MQSETRPTSRPARQKQNRPRNHRHREDPNRTFDLSDSNLPSDSTPDPKNPPRQKQSGDRNASLAVPGNKSEHSAQQRNRPISIAAPNPSVMVTPSKAAAYAGSAFQASPAPSALPVPKFFSKSVPSTNNTEASFSARMEKEADKPDVSDTERGGLAAPNSRAQGHSPLDMFFKADREEKARKQSNSTLNVASTPSRNATPERTKDLFAMDMEDADSPVARKAQMSSQQNRTGPQHIYQGSPSGKPDDEASRAIYTQSLKDLLNVQPNGSPQSATPPSQHFQQDNQGSPLAHRQSPALTTPQNNRQQQYQNDFHYGNRNLSPMFQAARTESPSRPSPLRQTSQPSPASNQTYDPNSFARAYLQQQVPESSPFRSQGPPQGQHFPPPQQQHQQQQQHPPQYHQYQQPSFAPPPNHFQQGVPLNQGQGFAPSRSPYQQHAVPSQPQNSKPSAPANNLAQMEDSLRRMLKLT